MWVSAFFGMATKYAEGLLAIRYRIKDENNQMAGGPMYYLERGLGSKWLAKIFAFLELLWRYWELEHLLKLNQFLMQWSYRLMFHQLLQRFY